ncbi:spore germination protein [Pseudalkalibacillus sp. R45]|uniref:spore germination protein n=1 Tax=Pseudalkalibacillus sp. R45 TaxID=3457433 RepID=UPI003FCCE8A8
MKKLIGRSSKKIRNKERLTEQTTLKKNEPLSADLNENIERITTLMGDSIDLHIQRFQSGNGVELALIYMEGMVDQHILTHSITSALMDLKMIEVPDDIKAVDYFTESVLSTSKTMRLNKWNDTVSVLLSGDAVILIQGSDQGIGCYCKGGKTRDITEPSSELVVRGPKDSFTESLRTNTSLIRQRIRNPALRIKSMHIGEVTKTEINILYLDGIAKESLIKELKDRLSKIKIDGVLESGYLEEFIQDQTFTPFPQVMNTERPDVVTGNLLEGRIAVLVEGTPFGLILPVSFFQFFTSPEDYYLRADIATFLRLLRIFVFFVSLLAPSLYIAITTFHQEMIPTVLLLGLAAQQEGVPFPAFVEAMIMEITFEILREAGIRMPRAIGQAISIVGAVILGEAAVQAGLVSPVMVIVVALTAISSFATPRFNIAISARLIRFVLMISAATFGFYGITIVLIMMIAHLSSLRSLGIPYLTSVAPFNASDQKDTFIRFPLWSMMTRPHETSQKSALERNSADE